MQLFLRVSQYYILRGNVPFPRAGHICLETEAILTVIIPEGELALHALSVCLCVASVAHTHLQCRLLC